SHEARRAASVMPTSHTIETHPSTPSLRVGAASTSSTSASTVVGSVGASVSAGVPAAGSASVATGSSVAGSGMADPGVDDGVQDVDGEVDDDVEDGEHGDEALEGHVLALEDRLADGRAHAGDAEDHLDDDGAADERPDVHAGDGEQRQARRPQGVAPQHPLVG